MGSFQTWFHSILAAAISAAASGVTLVIVDPASFNFSSDGLKHLGAVCAVQAIIAVAAFLKQSPLPDNAPKP